MRFFEVLAAGACFLTDAPPELERHFIRDEHLATFDNAGELVLKLKELLGDETLRKSIAHAGHEQVMAHHTYEHLAKEFISQYDSLATKAD